jgi:hypothetical protein
MILLGREETFKACEQRGEIVTRAGLEAGHYQGKESFVREWLLVKVTERRGQLGAENLARSDRAVRAAEKSASAAETSARYAILGVAFFSCRPCSNRHPWMLGLNART